MPFVAIARFILLIALSTLLAVGCASNPDNGDSTRTKADYKKSRETRPLEIPPDLTEPGKDSSLEIPDLVTGADGSAKYSDYASGRSKETPNPNLVGTEVLPELDSVRVQRQGQTYWLELDGDPTQVWNRLQQFWHENGILLQIDDPTIGIMETAWVENRADIPQGAVRKFLGKAFDSFYSASTRDKFRIRLEKGVGDAEGKTELYLTHRGLEETIEGGDFTSKGAVWHSRPTDKELELELLKRIMIFVGAKQEQAEQRVQQSGDEPQPPKAELLLTQDGEVSVAVQEPFPRAWRETGLALDRGGFLVEDRDRSKGSYFVRYRDPEGKEEKKGFWASLAFWSNDDEEKKDQYEVFLKPTDANTIIVILGKDGKQDNGDTARRILTLLQEELK